MRADETVVGPASSHVLETEIDDDVSLYDPSTEQVTVLNGTASDIWRLVDGTRTVAEITDLLASSYGVERSAIADDVRKTIGELTRAGLIDSP